MIGVLYLGYDGPLAHILFPSICLLVSVLGWGCRALGYSVQLYFTILMRCFVVSLLHVLSCRLACRSVDGKWFVAVAVPACADR